MIIDTIEFNNSISNHSWQKVNLHDADNSVDNIDEILLHYTLDKSSNITGVIGAVYSNDVSEYNDGKIISEFGNFKDVLVLLDNYKPMTIDMEIIIEGNNLSIRKKKIFRH